MGKASPDNKAVPVGREKRRELVAQMQTHRSKSEISALLWKAHGCVGVLLAYLMLIFAISGMA